MAHWCLVLFSVLLTRSCFAAQAGQQDIRRELATMKDMMADIEGKLEQFNTLYLMNLDKKVKEMEATLQTVVTKVGDINRKSILLSEIHQDNDARKDLLQRISRNVDDLVRKQSNSVGRKHKSEIERLDKLSENVQALFQIFGGMNRKLDDLQTRIERVSGGCPLNDLKLFLSKKIDSLAASTALLSECLECDRESLKDVLHTSVRHIVENVARKMHLCTSSDLERTVGRMLDNKWKTLVDSLQDDMNLKLGKVGYQLEDVKQECRRMNDEDTLSPSKDSHDVAYSHDTPQELRTTNKPRGDDSQPPRETPGRIFRKLWRKMTEPINKLGEKIEALGQVVEVSNQKYHNDTVSKLTAEISVKDKAAEPCAKQVQVLVDTTKDTAQRLGYIESRQLTVQNLCSKILVEVEHVKNTVETTGGGGGVGPGVSHVGKAGVTEAVEGAAKEGYEVARSCAELQEQGIVKNGIYTIKPKDAHQEFLAYCDLVTEGGGWTVIQRRGDYGELRQNFTQDWETYKRGFGDFLREFWMGNEKISLLSMQDNMKLRIELEDFDGNMAYAEYSRFKVEGENEQFRLSVGGYQGNATDSLSLHDAKMFSTVDRDNDEVASCCNCADTFKGGWWYYRCFEANLNGPYHTVPTENGYFLGIIWERWKGDYSLKSSEMKVRPLAFDEVRDP